MRKGQFETWFKGQFGARASKTPLEVLKQQASDAYDAAIKADLLYRVCERWDQDFNTALLGYNAAPKTGKGA